MEREQIIRMAREAGAVFPADGSYHCFEVPGTLERFAALVAAAEREACAKVAEGWTYLPEENFTKAQIVKNMSETIAHYIRARGIV